MGTKKRKTDNRRKYRKKKLLPKVLLILVGFIAVALLTFFIVRNIGKSKIYSANENVTIEIETAANEKLTEDEKTTWKPGWVKYNGKIYEYNEDIITFLFMGIDKDTDVVKVEEGTDGGQADALFLLVLNPTDQTMKVVAINRNAMTDINFYDENGNVTNTVKAQLAVQHGFGDGMEESCEYQVEAVRRLMYNLPIHGYAAINMSAIGTINDAVGGVDVVSLDKIKNGDTFEWLIEEGETVHLMGETAYWYVRDRDENVFASSDRRMTRQKQYLQAFVDKAKGVVKQDIAVALDIYSAVSEQMVTDITPDEITYLAPEAVKYGFDENSFYVTTGETVMGEQYEEFYVDEDALHNLIIEIFYKEVDIEQP